MKFKLSAAAIKRQIIILLLLLVAFFLRTYQLDSQSLRGDEAATVLYSALPIGDLWELSRVTDPHPPLYYLSLHPWQWLVGESAWAMRFAGVLASTLAVAALYTLVRRTLRQTEAALLAAGLLAVNPLQIWLAQDIRSYPFFTLLGLLSSWALWQAVVGGRGSGVGGWGSEDSNQKSVVSSQINTPHTPRPTPHLSSFILHPSSFTSWFLYILLTLTCFYIHYYTAFLILFHGLFVLVNLRRFWGSRWPWLVSQLVIALLMIPGLQLAYNFMGEAAGGIDKIAVPDILRLASTSLLTGFTLADSLGLAVSLLLLPLWLVGLLTLLRCDRLSGSFWTLFFAIPVLSVIALSIDRPFFKERFLVQAQPAFELLLAVGFLALWRLEIRDWRFLTKISSTFNKPYNLNDIHNSQFTIHNSQFLGVIRLLVSSLLAFLLLTNSVALTNYLTNPAYAKAPPWRFYHEYVSDHARPGDVMLTNFPEAAVSYYSPNKLPFYVVPAERDRPTAERLEQTEQIAGAYQRIWFLPMLRQGFDEQGDVLTWLDRHADRVHQVFFPDYNLNLYLSPPAIEAALISQSVVFAHGPRLRGYQIFDKEGDSRLTPDASRTGYRLSLKPEDKFTVSLYWQSNGPTDASYTVFVHLIAADGFNRAGQDNLPVWGSYPTTAWQPGEKITDKYTLAVPPGTPPGDHRLRLGWYNSATQERVPVVSDNSQPTGDSATLNVTIRVEAANGE
ncbi:MAG: glycosyltransferase family 39 protein [Anaerolineae bacterium]|nr:glycosyltransferase family 39 protein [Anaerolineae bacterium]